MNHYRHNYYLKHSGKIKVKAKDYYDAHKNDILEKRRMNRLQNRDAQSIRHREDYEKHRPKRIQRVREYYKLHHDEILEKRRASYLMDKEDVLLRCREYNLRHKEQTSLRHKGYYMRNKEAVLNHNKEYRDANKEHVSKLIKLRYEANREKRIRNKLDVKIDILKYYGNGYLACVKCGFTDIRALSIDHIEGDGLRHRKVNGITGDSFYLWLKRNNYPSGFQTLCMNCQFIKKIDNSENGRKLEEVEICSSLV